jgi:hypothetical protein
MCLPVLPACTAHVLQIKQNVLLRYRYLAGFLKQQAPDIYAEVGGGQWAAQPLRVVVCWRECCFGCFGVCGAALTCCCPLVPYCLYCDVQVRGAYVDKVGQKMLDLFRTYWAAMERLEVSADLAVTWHVL